MFFIQALYQICDFENMFPFCGMSFHFPNSVFSKIRPFNFHEAQLSHLWDMVFFLLDGVPSEPVLCFSGWRLPGFYAGSVLPFYLEHLLKQMKSQSSNKSY